MGQTKSAAESLQQGAFRPLQQDAFQSLQHGASLKGLLKPFKGKGELTQFADQCQTLRAGLKDLAHGVSEQAKRHPFSLLPGRLIEQNTTVGTMFLRWQHVSTRRMGVVLNVLLAWPDCCFRPEVVKHPRSKDTLAYVPSIFGDEDLMPKEQALLDLCLSEKANNRKVLAYSVYTGTRDTTARLKRVLETAGLKVAVLRASVDTARREDWILDQVDRGIDVLITNPELVKTGLDLLDFPTIAFLQTGYNVYTLQQASRRSWRIGQKQRVRVVFFGYAGTSQITCLQLMARKIAVAQSTSGDVPESGLDSLNQDGDSVEMALARQLIAM